MFKRLSFLTAAAVIWTAAYAVEYNNDKNEPEALSEKAQETAYDETLDNQQDTHIPAEMAREAEDDKTEPVDAVTYGDMQDAQTPAEVVNFKGDPALETFAENEAANTAVIDIPPGGFDVYVVPIEGPIGSPQLFILRRALKQAIENDVECVVLQMDTPGGQLGVTLEMMEALDNFDGETITFVDDEAISAGSYISVACDKIYFAPKGIMGAAEVVAGTGDEVNESMKRKINSYLRAKVRVLSEKYRYRADVQRAMMDESFVFEVGDKIIKPEGELLSLTASEAAKKYGDPPQALLSSGTVETVEELLNMRYGQGNYQIQQFELTWSEDFAKWFANIAPFLFGIGVLMIIIEIKTPHFGLLGGIGIALVLIVFASNYFAGLAGNEPILLFALGVILILLEILFFPGVFVMVILGLACILGSLIWSMADIWPTPDGGITISMAALTEAIENAFIAMGIAVVGLLAMWRFLPGSSIFRRYVSEGAIDGVSEVDAGGGSSSSGQTSLPDIGARGTVVKDLHPMGMIEIDGHQYQAKSAHGEIQRGQHVVVVKRGSFALVVEKAS